MANIIKIKNSGTANSSPSSLDYGELAINYSDGKLFYKNSSNTIISFPLSSGAKVTNSDTPPSSPSVNDIWFESDTGKTFIYYDSFWVEMATQGGPQGATGPTGATGISPSPNLVGGGQYYRPPYLASNNGTMSIGSQAAFVPMYLSSGTYDRIGFTTGTSAVTTSGVGRCAIYTDSNGKPGTLIVDSGSIAYTTAATSYVATINQTLAAGWYWVGGLIQSGVSNFMTLSAYPTSFINGMMLSPTSILLYNSWGFNGVTGAFPTNPNVNAPGGYTVLCVYLRTV